MDVLIIGRSGHLQNGLIAILGIYPNLAAIYIADNIKDGLIQFKKYNPSLIIIDAPFPQEDDCLQLREAIANGRDSKCLMIVETQDEHKWAIATAADECMMRGFSTSSLFATIDKLFDTSGDIRPTNLGGNYFSTAQRRPANTNRLAD